MDMLDAPLSFGSDASFDRLIDVDLNQAHDPSPPKPDLKSCKQNLSNAETLFPHAPNRAPMISYAIRWSSR
jgi:hypothetical protein